jgi:hypothetical protein
MDAEADGQASEGSKQPPEDGELPPKCEEAGTEGYDSKAAAREDRDAAVSDIREIIADLRAEITELRVEAVAIRQTSAETTEMLAQELQQAERHEVEYQRLIALLDEILRRGPNQGPDLGCQAASKAKVLKEETRRARKKWPGRVWDRIWDKLKTVLPRIWSMISSLLTVKEWTISGQAGSTLFGLAQVGISITFG